MQTKDVFISYGRRESLNFTARLHRALKLRGYEGWFDKVNIPDGEDYALRISNGIESADNFVYIMAPRCLESPYSLMEIEQARHWGKRVIPVNQDQRWQSKNNKTLSAGDLAVLDNFYTTYGIPNPGLKTEDDVVARSMELVGRTDWLDSKEKVDDKAIAEIAAWQAEYESFWPKHDDIEFLKECKLPQFGESIDPFDNVVENIIAVIERQKDYVQSHNLWLSHALKWKERQRSTQYLLVGKERHSAEEWLLQDFTPPKQPPCTPSALVCEFICEARKNAENMMTDAFICYDREEVRQRDSVIRALARHCITAWTHDKDITKGAEYGKAIERGIEEADNFLFFLSPKSVRSEYCIKELKHAVKYHKRIVPLLIEELPAEDIPEEIRDLQYIDFTDNNEQKDFDQDIDDILNILHHEQSYFEQHKILLARALKWEREGRKPSFLLRGFNLDNAVTWLRLNEERETYAPTELHKELISSSVAAKGQLGTEVFVSYSRKDGDFARRLNKKLQESGKTTWFDQESISEGVNFENEIFKGIDGADNFVFVISPDSINSIYCEKEVNYAASQNKRMIPILWRKADDAKIPKAIAEINWIIFEGNDFDTKFKDLIQELELDREHAQQHTILQQRATEWEGNQRSQDFLLNATALKGAEEWLEESKGKNPKPTDTQRDYIQASRDEMDRQEAERKRIARVMEKRLKNTRTALAGAAILLFISIFLGVTSWKTYTEFQVVTYKNHITQAEDLIQKALYAEALKVTQAALEIREGDEEAQRLQNDAQKALENKPTFERLTREVDSLTRTSPKNWGENWLVELEKWELGYRKLDSAKRLNYNFGYYTLKSQQLKTEVLPWVAGQKKNAQRFLKAGDKESAWRFFIEPALRLDPRDEELQKLKAQCGR